MALTPELLVELQEKVDALKAASANDADALTAQVAADAALTAASATATAAAVAIQGTAAVLEQTEADLLAFVQAL